jgi:hypothetical protein
MTTNSPEIPPTVVSRRRRTAVRIVALMLCAGCCAFALAGCKSGTITGSEQACKSTGSLFAEKQVACTGSVDSVRGAPSLGIIDTGEELSGSYKLDATITVGKGEAKAYVSTADGKEGGRVSPGEPLRIGALVGLDEDDEEVAVDLKVLGKGVEDLRYEATGSSTLNRGQAARSASSSHRGFLPRHLGSSAGGTGYLNNSSTDQRCSVSPAAIAGVRPSPREQCLHTRL